MGVLGLFDNVADEDKALRRREAFHQHVEALEAKDPPRLPWWSPRGGWSRGHIDRS